jgi:uncharacterized protein (TIGR00255 family)
LHVPYDTLYTTITELFCGLEGVDWEPQDGNGLPDDCAVGLWNEIDTFSLQTFFNEGIDRLDAHVVAARELLSADKPVGRRLDFLAQEFNREVNTVCSKSNDRALTAIGLDLKAVVDQLREQIQNLE